MLMNRFIVRYYTMGSYGYTVKTESFDTEDERTEFILGKAKAKDLQDQGIETSIFDARMEPMINEILKQSGAVREKLQ